MCFGMCCVVGWMVPNVMCSQYWQPCTQQHSITSEKTGVRSVTTSRTSSFRLYTGCNSLRYCAEFGCTTFQQIDGTKPGVAGSGEGVLANFFNSLLHKKTGTGSPAPKMSGDDCEIAILLLDMVNSNCTTFSCEINVSCDCNMWLNDVKLSLNISGKIQQIWFIEGGGTC